MKKSLETVQRFWDARARAGTSDHQRVDTNLRTQYMRFLAFVQACKIEGDSILDIGCGTGAFLDFLRKRGITSDYTGFDLSPAMIARCRELFPDEAFVAGDFLEWQPGKTYDYAIAIAIHNNVRIADGWDILDATLRKQFALANKAAHMSVLSSTFTGFSSDMKAWDPHQVLALAMDITPHVVLRHDYLPHDFSVTLFKDPTIDAWLGPRDAEGGA